MLGCSKSFTNESQSGPRPHAKQILRLLESDGLHRNPEIGPRSARNDCRPDPTYGRTICFFLATGGEV